MASILMGGHTGLDPRKKKMVVAITSDDVIKESKSYRVLSEDKDNYTISIGPIKSYTCSKGMFKDLDYTFKDADSHYKQSVEPIDLIEAFGLNFNRGNVIKYVARAGRKDDELQDLRKALWYLEREIKNIEDGRK